MLRVRSRVAARAWRWAAIGLAVGALSAAGPAGAAATLETLYAERCAQCHASGAGGAPVPGDSAEWSRRLSAGRSLVYRSALEGMPNTAMAAKGGHRDLADDTVRALVDHMLAQTRLEPAVIKEAARYESLGIRSRSFVRLDANRDGFLDRTEVREDAGMVARFASFDRDGDGRLNEAEFVRAESALAAERAKVQVDDEGLRVRVREALMAVEGMSMSGIRIEIAAGAVSVAGVVQSGDIARRAEAVLRRIAGIRSLDFRLMSGEMLHFD